MEELIMNYHLPTIPYSPVDLINRRAAATGSVRYAMATSHADYNGHFVSVTFKPHAVCGPVWNAEYHWGERVVLGRGSLRSCLAAAKQEYDRGALGTTVALKLDEQAPESIEEQKALAAEFGFVGGGEASNLNVLGDRPAFWTDKHEAVSDALSWEKDFPGIVAEALKFEGAFAGWPAARRAWLESRKKIWNKEREEQ